MKKLLTPFLFLICLPLFAQENALPKSHRFSIGIEAGTVNTFLNIPEEYFYGCFCCFGDCVLPPSPTDDTYDLLPHPTNSRQAAIMVNYQLNKRHEIGLGFLMSQYGESHLTLGEYKRQVVDFRGISARHSLKLFNGNRMDFLMSNSFNLEVPKNAAFYINTHTGLSHTGGFTLSYSLWPSFDVELSAIGKTALTKYADYAWTGKNSRFGYGAMVGLIYRI
jgi:hypothetical protein